MNAIGLDVGTTTISAVAVELGTGRQLDRVTIPNDTFIKTENPWEKVQSVEKICRKAFSVIAELEKKHAPVGAIGFAGQMHGIVYTDKDGNAVSDFIIWQDGRGSLVQKDGRTFVKQLSEKTGYALATGYGLVTHAWNVANNCVPEGAAGMTTIYGYLAMRLTGRKKPLLHVSDAASLGAFDLEKNAFDLEAVEKMGIDPAILPEVTADNLFMGKTENGVAVAVGIGDNQASFLGSVPDKMTGVLVNLGTGGQISAYVERPVTNGEAEARPYIEGGYLMVGSPLCGGRAYAIVEKFLRACVQMAGVECAPLYEQMNRLAMDEYENPMRLTTDFCGRRSDPDLRACLSNISEDNFTPGNLVRATLAGLAEEMYSIYECMKPYLPGKVDTVVCSGNAVRLNPAMQKILPRRFGLEAFIPEITEEAAFGAAIFAGRCHE